MTILTLVFWCLMAIITLLLITLTVSYLTHDPATCRTCVHRAANARRRHPSHTPAEDRPEWGRW